MGVRPDECRPARARRVRGPVTACPKRRGHPTGRALLAALDRTIEGTAAAPVEACAASRWRRNGGVPSCCAARSGSTRSAPGQRGGDVRHCATPRRAAHARRELRRAVASTIRRRFQRSRLGSGEVCPPRRWPAGTTRARNMTPMRSETVGAVRPAARVRRSRAEQCRLRGRHLAGGRFDLPSRSTCRRAACSTRVPTAAGPAASTRGADRLVLTGRGRWTISSRRGSSGAGEFGRGRTLARRRRH